MRKLVKKCNRKHETPRRLHERRGERKGVQIQDTRTVGKLKEIGANITNGLGDVKEGGARKTAAEPLREKRPSKQEDAAMRRKHLETHRGSCLARKEGAWIK